MMRYRKFGKSNWLISEISIGVLRLEEAVTHFDETDVIRRAETIKYAIDRGVNFINLGYPSYFENPERLAHTSERR
jgi:aryl-alcohol dehydrogenase-like predicted oxidoreductase